VSPAGRRSMTRTGYNEPSRQRHCTRVPMSMGSRIPSAVTICATGASSFFATGTRRGGALLPCYPGKGPDGGICQYADWYGVFLGSRASQGRSLRDVRIRHTSSRCLRSGFGAKNRPSSRRFRNSRVGRVIRPAPPVAVVIVPQKNARTFPRAGAVSVFSGSAAAATIAIGDRPCLTILLRGRGRSRKTSEGQDSSAFSGHHQENNRAEVCFNCRIGPLRRAQKAALTMVLPTIGSESFPRTKRFDARDRLALIHNAKRRTTGVRFHRTSVHCTCV
jgi:hypothetical protein